MNVLTMIDIVFTAYKQKNVKQLLLRDEDLSDRDTKKAEFLFVTQPALTKYQLSSMRCEVIKARDGLELPAYLTLPVGAEPKGLPMILNVHGGPWARDAWGFRPDTQWFANRGYAVLQVSASDSASLLGHVQLTHARVQACKVCKM